jgi:hypothetical protein
LADDLAVAVLIGPAASASRALDFVFCACRVMRSVAEEATSVTAALA